MKCKHCNGLIVSRYDEVFCINCSRPAVQPQPAFTEEELVYDLKLVSKGDKSMNQKIRPRPSKRRPTWLKVY